VFVKDHLYEQSSPEVIAIFGDPKAQAQRRYRGDYPRYIKSGRRIFLYGREIIEYLEQNSVLP